MAARFWVGGTGTWDGVTTTHWSTTSGGSSGAAVPTSSDDVTFDSNSGTSATVTIATVTANANSITINKSDLTLLHTAGSTVIGAVTLTTGILNTNGQTCSWGSLVSNNSNARTVTLGASAISLNTAAATVLNTATSTNLTWTANTATFTCPSAAATVTTGGKNYNGLSFVMTGSGTPSFGSATIANLTRTGTATKTDKIQFNGNITITGTLTLNGNTNTNRLLVQTSAPGTSITTTAATVSATNVDFMDITAAGAASWDLHAITGLSGDCGGNTGITFTTPATQTWNGNTTSTWTTAANWTSRAPLAQDNVIINGLTSGTITANAARLGANIDCTGSTGGTITFSGGPSTCFGNFKWVSGMTAGGTGFTLAGRGSQTYTSAGTTLAGTTIISAPGGTYTFQDNFICANTLTLSAGTMSAVTTNVTATQFIMSGVSTSTINMGSGTWTATGTGNIWNTPASNLTINPQTSTFIVNDVSSTLKTINNSAGSTFNTLTASGDNIKLILNNTIANLNVNNAGLPTGLLLASGGTQTITNSFTTNGSAGNLAILAASSAGTQASISKSSGTVSVDYMSIKDSAATGGASWYAGVHSTNVSDNSGWIFSAPASGNEFLTFM